MQLLHQLFAGGEGVGLQLGLVASACGCFLAEHLLGGRGVEAVPCGGEVEVVLVQFREDLLLFFGVAAVVAEQQFAQHEQFFASVLLLVVLDSCSQFRGQLGALRLRSLESFEELEVELGLAAGDEPVEHRLALLALFCEHVALQHLVEVLATHYYILFIS